MALHALAENPETFGHSDITLWGIVALAACGVAVLSASLSVFLPPGVLTGLHATRLESGNLNALRTELTDLRLQTSQLRRQNNEMLSRLSVAERSRGDMTRRVGALEHSIPALLEALPPDTKVDKSLLTSSIGSAGQDGDMVTTADGTMRVSHHPLFEKQAATPPASGSSAPATQVQPMPPKPAAAEKPVGTTQTAAVKTTENAAKSELAAADFAIALGPKVSPKKARAQWQALNDKVGTLLLGFDPLYSVTPGNGENHVVVGPIPSRSQAEELCARMVPIGIDCQPVKYHGNPI